MGTGWAGLLKAALIKAVASSVSGQHDTFLLGDLRVAGPAISPGRSQEVVMWRAQTCRQASTFKRFSGGSSTVYTCVRVCA